MDPPLSVSNDPHHPPQFNTFPPQFTTFPPQFTNSNPFTGPNHPFYSPSAVPPPQTSPATPHPSFNHPPYADMICTAIAALNEPEGSSKQAISKYIERIYTELPPAHNALLSHHLRSLKNSGILMMVRKSYKFAVTPPPPPASTAIEPPRSENFTVNANNPLPDPVVSSTPQTQKRGRGRPPKPKPDLQIQPSDGIVQSNGKPNEFPIFRPVEEFQPLPQPPQPQPSVKRPPGRPRKDGALPIPKVSVSGVSSGVEAVNSVSGVSGGVEAVKRRGRPPSGRAAGRERKPTVVSAPVSVIPYVANGGVRRRGRPKRVDAGVSSVAAPLPLPLPLQSNVESGGGEDVAVVKRRGRGRPPKIGGVIRKPMKQMRRISRTGRPLGRPRKNSVSIGGSGQQDGGYVELKRKFELFVARAKDIVVVLKSEIGGSENQALVRAVQSLEELTGETVEEPQHMEEEEMHVDEEHPETEPVPVGQGGQAQTEAEAMQEALF